MLTNAEMKSIRSLREKKFRDELELFTVEGEKSVAEALRISQCATPSPVLAVVRMPKEDRPAELPGGLALALDSVRDPGNFGTILRIADWFGVSQVFASPDSVETFNPKTVQASMGSVFRVRVSRCDIAALCAEFSSAGRRVYGTVRPTASWSWAMNPTASARRWPAGWTAACASRLSAAVPSR